MHLVLYTSVLRLVEKDSGKEREVIVAVKTLRDSTRKTVDQSGKWVSWGIGRVESTVANLESYLGHYSRSPCILQSKPCSLAAHARHIPGAIWIGNCTALVTTGGHKKVSSSNGRGWLLRQDLRRESNGMGETGIVARDMTILT